MTSRVLLIKKHVRITASRLQAINILAPWVQGFAFWCMQGLGRIAPHVAVIASPTMGLGHQGSRIMGYWV